VGKWGFIWLAYAVAGAALAAYAVGLWRRLSESARDLAALQGSAERSGS
jgi:heme exporter protein D